MYQLPEDFDFELLSNCYLDMVCFGPSTARLEFSRVGSPYGVSIVLEGRFTFASNGVVGERDLGSSMSIAPLLDLLTRDVASLIKVGPASLRINFLPNGSVNLDGDSSAGFESYTIYPNVGDPIVV
jgi:hypothetical protein